LLEGVENVLCRGLEVWYNQSRVVRKCPEECMSVVVWLDKFAVKAAKE
jgi:hypothetical protein